MDEPPQASQSSDAQSDAGEIYLLRQVVEHLLLSVTSLERWKEHAEGEIAALRADLHRGTRTSSRPTAEHHPESEPGVPSLVGDVHSSRLLDGLREAMEKEIHFWEERVAKAKQREEHAVRQCSIMLEALPWAPTR
jgi:hypothetical protein